MFDFFFFSFRFSSQYIGYVVRHGFIAFFLQWYCWSIFYVWFNTRTPSKDALLVKLYTIGVKMTPAGVQVLNENNLPKCHKCGLDFKKNRSPLIHSSFLDNVTWMSADCSGFQPRKNNLYHREQTLYTGNGHSCSSNTHYAYQVATGARLMLIYANYESSITRWHIQRWGLCDPLWGIGAHAWSSSGRATILSEYPQSSQRT